MARIHVLYTGGTFGSKPSGPAADGPLAPMTLEELQTLLPDSSRIVPGVDVAVDRYTRLLDSSSMQPGDWHDIARDLAARYDQFDGFVIVHGTDTLAYTASALGLLLENLAKPVVITGSQRPLVAPDSDAPRNYIQALRLAAGAAAGLPNIPEVVVAFGDRLLRGCRTRKLSASADNAFDSPNAPHLGRLRDDIRVFRGRLRAAPMPDAPLRVRPMLKGGVADLTLFPGISPQYVSSVLGAPGIKGAVLRTFGAGNAPERPALLRALKTAIASKGQTIVGISQCLHGSVEMGVYAAGTGLVECGVVPGRDMTPEAALAKLLVVLKRHRGQSAAELMQSDWCGELTAAP